MTLCSSSQNLNERLRYTLQNTRYWFNQDGQLRERFSICQPGPPSGSSNLALRFIQDGQRRERFPYANQVFTADPSTSPRLLPRCLVQLDAQVMELLEARLVTLPDLPDVSSAVNLHTFSKVNMTMLVDLPFLLALAPKSH
jgi:hypothetical protein